MVGSFPPEETKLTQTCQQWGIELLGTYGSNNALECRIRSLTTSNFPIKQKA